MGDSTAGTNDERLFAVRCTPYLETKSPVNVRYSDPFRVQIVFSLERGQRSNF